MSFQGPERRRHKLYVTKNTEYHVRDGIVVAVRERGQEDWDVKHSAVGLAICGRIESGTYAPIEGDPTPGDRLYLAAGDDDVVTSTVIAVERPAREAVASYPAIVAA
jgi:hypothetical protein